MSIKKKLVVSNGSYKLEDGTEKTRWLTIGALHEHGGKHYVTLDGHIALPALIKEGDTRVFANLFDPDPPRGQRARPAQAPIKDFDDDIPFDVLGRGMSSYVL
jgi:hypothetical protein